jgi:AraC-like DNA-binding protein
LAALAVAIEARDVDERRLFSAAAVSLDGAALLEVRSFYTRLSRGEIEAVDLECSAERLLTATLETIRSAPPRHHWRSAVTHHNRNQRLIERVCMRLESDPSAPHALADIGRDVGLSPFELARRFRQTVGVSVHRFLVRVRIARALERLADGEEDLAALAADLGFASHAHFSETFRRVTRSAPSAVRKRLSAYRS